MSIKIEKPKDFIELKEGWYECYVSAVDKAEVDEAKGIMKGNVNYKVRDDVHPDFAGAEIRYDYFSDAPNMAWKINAIASAVGIPEGTELEGLQDVFDFLKGKALKVKVKLEPKFNDPSVIYAKANGYKSSEATEYTPPVEDEDDLPF